MIELWVWLAVAAAFLQNLRFMLQRYLIVGGMTPVGSTFARFMFSAPIVVVAVALLLAWKGAPWPRLEAEFWLYATLGGASQIFATVLVVALFRLRNFAVGITLKKAETLLTVLVGYILLGDVVGTYGFVAIVIGVVGVVLLSDPPKIDERTALWKRMINKPAAFGVGSGLFFALSGVFYRGATLSVALDELPLKAGITLAMVGLIQIAMLTAYTIWKEPSTPALVVKSWRTVLPLGLLSAGGSWCWFAAFALVNNAYVFAIGQVEVLFSVIASVFVFGETITRREGVGIILLVVSILGVVLLG